MIEEFTRESPEEDQWAVESLDCKDNGRSFAATIIKGTAKAVSNGSFKNSIGTLVSLLFDRDHDNCIFLVN